MNILIIDVLQIKTYVLKVFLKCINTILNIMMKDIHYIKEDHHSKVEILFRKLYKKDQ